MPIHPTAILGKNAALGEDNEIGPHVIIEDNVTIGSRNKIWPNVYICSGTTIGDGNEIHMGAVIGNSPQDIAYQGAPTFALIGNRNTIREYVTIHRGAKEGSSTVIGDNNYLMANAHVAHNCEIASRTYLVNGAALAGYVTVEDDAFISGMTGFHQFTKVGRLAFVSGFSAVNLDVPPFMTAGGRGAVVHGPNVVGLRRAGIPPEARDEIKRAYRIFYLSGLKRADALEEIKRTCQSKEAAYLVSFIENSKRGVCKGGFAREFDTVRF